MTYFYQQLHDSNNSHKSLEPSVSTNAISTTIFHDGGSTNRDRGSHPLPAAILW